MPSAKRLACAAVLLLTACTPPTQYPIGKNGDQVPQPPVQRARQAYLQQTAGNPVICTMGEDCNNKWQKALTWVRAHAQYSIRTNSDTEITTYGPIEPTTDAGFTITRTQNDATSMAIHFTATCGKNACVPPALELESEFKNYLLTSTDLGNF